MKKKYSVLMSVYHKENPTWFDESIKSMFEQTIKPNEFVLVEDGPLTKELYDVVEKYKTKYPKEFKVVAIEKNVGLGPALKKGVEECSNEYIARMDSDDYSMPKRIEKEFEIFEKYSDIGMVGTNVSEFIDSIDNVVCNVILPETNEDIIKFSKSRNPFRHPSVMFKKSAVVNAANYREYYLCEDYDMWLRMIRNGCKCYNIQDIYVYMRIGEDFYKRRGGHKYFKSIKKFKKEQLENGYLTKFEYLKSIVPHAIVCYMPNFMRDFVYRKMLRRGRKNE
ncbi:glycosyltransferase [Streptococcus suis]|uniref:glycosyltransferase n=1 Tax=Streptococcus parasuis TaxID=1501662 RepID=UPI00240EBE97|nr:glycosyltransferase [Streptococcus parasuis]MDG3213261.1 glycosyltransferase [Streptococcus suis]